MEPEEWHFRLCSGGHNTAIYTHHSTHTYTYTHTLPTRRKRKESPGKNISVDKAFSEAKKMAELKSLANKFDLQDSQDGRRDVTVKLSAHLYSYTVAHNYPRPQTNKWM